MAAATIPLEYIAKEIILQSQLDDIVKHAYIERVEAVCRKLDSPSNDESDNLACCSEWRSLSIKFYRDAGIQGELEDIYPAGMESEYEIDLGLKVERGLLDTSDMRKEVEAVAREIRSEERLKIDTKAKIQFHFEVGQGLPIRPRLQGIYEFGKVRSESR